MVARSSGRVYAHRLARSFYMTLIGCGVRAKLAPCFRLHLHHAETACVSFCIKLQSFVSCAACDGKCLPVGPNNGSCVLPRCTAGRLLITAGRLLVYCKTVISALLDGYWCTAGRLLVYCRTVTDARQTIRPYQPDTQHVLGLQLYRPGCRTTCR